MNNKLVRNIFKLLNEKEELKTKFTKQEAKEILEKVKQKLYNDGKIFKDGDTRPTFTEEELEVLKNYNLYNTNLKTAVSLDFLPGHTGTCYMTCDYCYVIKLMKVYGSPVERKLVILTNLIKLFPEVYYNIIKPQLESIIQKNNLDVVRWFGSGDYQPYMKEAIIRIAQGLPNVHFAIISKTLVMLSNSIDEIRDLLKQPNIYINLSFHRYNYDKFEQFYKFRTAGDIEFRSNLRFAYTLEEYEGVKVYKIEEYKKEKEGYIILKKSDFTIPYIKKEILKKWFQIFERKINDIIFKFDINFDNEEEIKQQIENILNSSAFNDIKEEFKKHIINSLKKENINDKDIKETIQEFENKSKNLNYDNIIKQLKKKIEIQKKEKKVIKREKPSKQRPIGEKDKEETIKSLIISISPTLILKKLPEVYVELTPEYLERLSKFDVVFNVNRKTAFMLGYYVSPRLEGKTLRFCDCDIEFIHENKACVYCKKCYMASPVFSEQISENIEYLKNISYDEYNKLILENCEDVEYDEEKNIYRIYFFNIEDILK